MTTIQIIRLGFVLIVVVGVILAAIAIQWKKTGKFPWITILIILMLLGSAWGVRSYNEKQAQIEAARKAAAEYAKLHPPAPAVIIVPEYPESGTGHATKEVGLKAWLDPMKTSTRPSRAARYVFVEDTEVFFDDLDGPVNTNHKEWLNMPAGKYLVYPLKGDRIYFRWWQ